MESAGQRSCVVLLCKCSVRKQLQQQVVVQAMQTFFTTAVLVCSRFLFGEFLPSLEVRKSGLTGNSFTSTPRLVLQLPLPSGVDDDDGHDQAVLH